MSIIVNPHNPKEEQALLAFLDSKKYDYTMDNETVLLSEAQKQEILERDRQYEAGETENYSLDEIIAHFNIKEK
jgi:PHD/YefM family antitoxin component YafN of YafNO toxin-antitoxin module